METLQNVVTTLAEASVVALSLMVALGVIGLSAYCIRVVSQREDK